MARSKRIELLSDLCQGYDTVIDIGSDHGLVLKAAFEKGRINKGIATDLREKPLQSAQKNLKNYPVSFVISDGFLAVRESFDLAVIAGMGAYLISEILEHAPKGKIDFILQANDKVHVLRDYLQSHGFMITDEWVIYDHFYYVIIKATYGHMQLSDDDLFLGPILKTKKEASLFYQYKIRQIEQLMRKASGSRRDELAKLLETYNRGIMC